MSKKCELTGKSPITGNKVSHSNVKTRTRWLPNLVQKRYTIEELGLTLSLRLSTSAIRTIDKQGDISNAIRLAKEANLSDRLRTIQRRLMRRRVAQ